MKLPVRVRTAARRDVPAVVSLLSQAFRVPLDQPTWEWYVYGNPFGETRVYVPLDDQEEPAGVFAFTPVPLRINGSPILASSGHHLFLKPSLQGGPAFIALSREALKGEAGKGVQLGLGLPNRRSYQPQKALIKWQDFCFLECWYKPSPARRAHDCRPVDRFTPSFDDFYPQVARTLQFCIDKNAEWMNWRFLDRPGKPYTVYAAGPASSLTGYVVLKRWREADGYLKAHIIDLHAADEEALSNLIAAANSYAASCDEINLWVSPGFPYGNFLWECGFAARESARQPLISRTLCGDRLAFPGGGSSFSYADGDFAY